MRLFGGQRDVRRLPAPATGQRPQPVEEATREQQELQSLARALLAARLGEALVLQAARSCRIDDLQQVACR